VPPLKDVVRVVEYDHSLDECANEVADAGKVDLPADSCEPSGIVAQHFLIARWCEFGNPMVLPACCGRHRGHLRQTGIDQGLAEYTAQETPEVQRCSAINEREVQVSMSLSAELQQRGVATCVRMPSQLATQVQANPSMVMKLKLRCDKVSYISLAFQTSTHAKHLLLAQICHISFVRICSSVFRGHVADALVKDLRRSSIVARHLDV
jgi:hypothetical protein